MKLSGAEQLCSAEIPGDIPFWCPPHSSSWGPDQCASLDLDACVHGGGSEDPTWNRRGKTNVSSRYFCPLVLYIWIQLEIRVLSVSGYYGKLGLVPDKIDGSSPRDEPSSPSTCYRPLSVTDCTMEKSGQHPNKREYL